MLDLIFKGGPVMWPITALGIIAIAIITERTLYFYFTEYDYAKFRDFLIDKISGKDLSGISAAELNSNQSGGQSADGFIAKSRLTRNPYIKIASVYLKNINRGDRSREGALRRTGSEVIDAMEKNFKGLSAISHVSPLLGLLGTVTGIIGSFSVISRLGGQVDVTALAGGIWEAMLTTAAGLIVAIPSQLAFMYFEKLVSARSNRMSYIITLLDEELYGNRDCCGNVHSSAKELFKHEETVPEGMEGI